MENATRFGQKNGIAERTKIPLPSPDSWTEKFWNDKRLKAEAEARQNARQAAKSNEKVLAAMKRSHDSKFFKLIHHGIIIQQFVMKLIRFYLFLLNI